MPLTSVTSPILTLPGPPSPVPNQINIISYYTWCQMTSSKSNQNLEKYISGLLLKYTYMPNCIPWCLAAFTLSVDGFFFFFYYCGPHFSKKRDAVISALSPIIFFSPLRRVSGKKPTQSVFAKKYLFPQFLKRRKTVFKMKLHSDQVPVENLELKWMMIWRWKWWWIIFWLSDFYKLVFFLRGRKTMATRVVDLTDRLSLVMRTSFLRQNWKYIKKGRKNRALIF